MVPDGFRPDAADALLAEIVRRTIEVAQPERIILFGSAARGDARAGSDIDLLVVKSGTYRKRAVASSILARMADLDTALDVVVVTPDDMERYKDSPALVIRSALREGRVLYAA